MDIYFSIIIPHRNIPVLLERLINSIPVRDDLEIIVVDDHSDPDKVDIEHFPCKERKNFRLVLNKECHGAGYARNCALPIAKGRWVLFADSDDFFNSGFDDFLNEYIDSDADIVYFNANSVDTDTYEPSNRVDHLHDFISEYKKDKVRGELIMRYLFTEPWCKMVKRELINKYCIKFEETSIRNDVRYSYLVGHYAQKIIVDERQLYCVTTRQNSVSRGAGYQASMDELKVFAGWKKFFIDHHIPLELPKFDLCAYNFTRNLWKDNHLFRDEYRVLRNVGLSHIFIIKLIFYYIRKSIRYKWRL
jgi:glycosyltransferase involved in cell wall biosynthesis